MNRQLKLLPVGNLNVTIAPKSVNRSIRLHRDSIANEIDAAFPYARTPVNRSPHCLIPLAKMALAVAILGFLAYRVQQNQGFARLLNEPKNWGLLAAALVCTLLSITLSFVRWHVLVNALGLSFRLVDALRLGALGFALNFVSLGSVGGDLFKAIFLAKEYPGRRTEAVATVMVDRLLGLLMMMVLASAAILIADWRDAPPEIALLCRMILLATVVAICRRGTVCCSVPLLTDERIRGWVGASAAGWWDRREVDWSGRGVSRSEVAALSGGRHWSGRRCACS